VIIWERILPRAVQQEVLEAVELVEVVLGLIVVMGFVIMEKLGIVVQLIAVRRVRITIMMNMINVEDLVMELLILRVSLIMWLYIKIVVPEIFLIHAL
jgi:hypothetical protein